MKVVAPVSRVEEIAPMIAAGADELYFGVVPLGWTERFAQTAVGRRAFGNLPDGDGLRRAVDQIRARDKRALLALNGQHYGEGHIELLLPMVRRFAEMGGGGIIVADPSLLIRLAAEKLGTRLHVSSVAACRNREAARFYAELGASRIVFPRHLTLDEMSGMVRACPDLEFEAFVLNDGCVFEEGLCHTLHLPGELGGPFCMDDYAAYYRRDDGGALSRAEARVLEANNAAYKEWLWYKFSCGFTTTPDGFPYGPCGLCALPLLAASGISAVKLAGRETPTERKLKSLALVRSVLTSMAEHRDPARTMAHAQGLRGCPERCATGYMCYYPEVLRASAPERPEAPSSAKR